jgi:hypothetical protein
MRSSAQIFLEARSGQRASGFTSNITFSRLQFFWVHLWVQLDLQKSEHCVKRIVGTNADRNRTHLRWGFRLVAQSVAQSFTPSAELVSFGSPSGWIRFSLRHFSSQCQQKIPVRLAIVSEYSTELVKHPRFVSFRPSSIARKFGKSRFRWSLPFVEKHVHRDFHRPSHFPQRFDCRNRVPVLDPRDVAPQESSALFGVSLGHIFSSRKALNPSAMNILTCDDNGVASLYKSWRIKT